MAISKAKKQSLVAELTKLLQNAKMAAFATFAGISVKDLQVLRRAAREQNVVVKVVKNRLVRVALAKNDTLKDLATDDLKGQILYAFSAEDEVMSAKILADFAKTHPEMSLLGGFSGAGANLSEAEVGDLAKLPSKDELIAQVIATLQSPVNDVISALNPLGSLVNALEAHAA